MYYYDPPHTAAFQFFATIAVETYMDRSATSIFELSPSEKLQLVEDLWDDLASTPDSVPVHDWQIEELERRKRNLQANPGSGLNWEEVKQRVRRQHGR